MTVEKAMKVGDDAPICVGSEPELVLHNSKDNYGKNLNFNLYSIN